MSITSERDARRAPAILDGRTGERIAFDALVARARAADALFIGETHGHPLGLRFAAALWEDMLMSAEAERAALSLEFLERDSQAIVDDYLTGVSNRDSFESALEADGATLPAPHLRMVHTAREMDARVLAANAPRRYVRLARTEGYDRLRLLTDAQRRLFTLPDALPDGRYRDDFESVMRPMFSGGAHGGGDDQAGPDDAEISARIEAFYRAQVTWDATMAETVSRALGAGRRPVVHVVGRFHTDFAGATAAMVRSRRPEADVITLSVIDAARDDLAPEDRERADYVVYVGSDDESDRSR